MLFRAYQNQRPGAFLRLSLILVLLFGSSPSTWALPNNSLELQGYPPPAPEVSEESPQVDPTGTSAVIEDVSPLTDRAQMPACHLAAVQYVSKRTGIVAEALLAGDFVQLKPGAYSVDTVETWIKLPNLGMDVCVVTVTSVDGSGVHETIGIDRQGNVVDYYALRQKDQAAEQERCGKFDPALCELIRSGDVPAPLKLVVHFVDPVFADVTASLHSKYPDVVSTDPNAPLNSSSPDYERALAERSEALRTAYTSLHNRWTEYLSIRGVELLSLSDDSPNAFVAVNGEHKPILGQLSGLPEVAGLSYLPSLRPRLSSVVATDHVAPFWSAGFTGTGIRIGLAEHGLPNLTNTYVDHLNGGVCGSASPQAFENDHATRVLGVLGMRDHPYHIGVAPNSTVIAGGFGGPATDANLAPVVSCLLNTPNLVDVINASFGTTRSDPNAPLSYFSRYFDRVAHIDRRLTVVATDQGVSNPNIGDPDAAYNVLSVGLYYDNSTGHWSDDVLTFDLEVSAYIGPGSRNKPEVVAPGVRICTADMSTVVQDCNAWDTRIAGRNGTSYAAPQVTGLAALLMQITGLKRSPEVIKALIMASAVHNIEGAARLSDRDGVGAIDGTLALEAARKLQYSARYITDSSFGADGAVHQSITASRGERVRIVLTYNTHPDASAFTDNDFADLNLVVYGPGSATTAVASSNSPVDLWEVVDFVAPETGIYDVRILRPRWDPSNPGENIGLAWVKDATYVPNVRNQLGYNTLVYFQNVGSTTRDIRVHVSNPNGDNPLGGANHLICYSLAPNQACRLDANAYIPANTMASLVTDGSEDVSVTVVHLRSSPTTVRGSITGIPITKLSGNMLLPLVMKSRATASGTSSSAIMIRNLSSQVRAFNIEFIPLPGSGYGAFTRQFWLNPEGSTFYELKWESEGALPSGWIGSARVYDASSPGSASFAVAVDNYSWSEETAQAQNVFPLGITIRQWAVPMFLVRVSTQTGDVTSTPVTIQNLSGTTLNASQISMYCKPTTAGFSEFSVVGPSGTNIPNWGTFSFNPLVDSTTFPVTGWTGTCTVSAPNNTNIAVLAQIRNSAGNTRMASGYEGLPVLPDVTGVYASAQMANRSLEFPIVYKRLSDGAAASLSIRNLSGSFPAHVLLTYTGRAISGACTQFGSHVREMEIPAGSAINRNLRLATPSTRPDAENGLPDGWCGSLTVVSFDQPIMGIGQLTNLTITSGDTMMVNNAYSRP